MKKFMIVSSAIALFFTTGAYSSDSDNEFMDSWSELDEIVSSQSSFHINEDEQNTVAETTVLNPSVTDEEWTTLDDHYDRQENMHNLNNRNKQLNDTGWLTTASRFGWSVYNMLQKPRYHKTGGAELFTHFSKTILDDQSNDFKASEKKDEYDDGRALYYTAKDDLYKNLVISTPCDDDDYSTSFRQLVCAKDVIAQVAQDFEKEEKVTLLIPLAQSRNYLNGNLARAHWTLLRLEKTGDSWQADHYDSKGALSAAYDLSHLNNFLPTGTTLKKHYLAHQGLLNNSDCGFYVLSMMRALVKYTEPAAIDNEYMNRLMQSFQD